MSIPERWKKNNVVRGQHFPHWDYLQWETLAEVILKIIFENRLTFKFFKLVWDDSTMKLSQSSIVVDVNLVCTAHIRHWCRIFCFPSYILKNISIYTYKKFAPDAAMMICNINVFYHALVQETLSDMHIWILKRN